mgnify:CR=1 FL=1
MKKIALCGFMGCGKSTISDALTNNHNLSHIDTDKYIEEKYSLTISDIFEKYGEEYFRDIEHETIAFLSQKNDCVLSLGGGAVIFKRNVDILKHNGYQIVFINTDFDVIKQRLFSDTSRPLLKTNDIKTLFDKRLELYKQACDIEIICKDEAPEKVAEMIINAIK